MHSQRNLSKICILVLVSSLVAVGVWADGGVTFTNVADTAGITYERVPSDRNAIERAFIEGPAQPTMDFFLARVGPLPLKPRGAPGVALLDYDGDGDLDIYGTNGPGAGNVLYSNQFEETGSVTFIDVAVAANADLTALDSNGVCFGDYDNDGDEDIYVVTYKADNVLLKNLGNGTFDDVTFAAGVGAGLRHPTSCAMADFDSDGNLDIIVANTYDGWERREVFLLGPTYPNLEHNQLFMSQGNGTFTDQSAASGLENNFNMDQPGLSGGSHTWALAAYDHDEDGDVDLLLADNQFTGPTDPSENRGYFRIFENDGAANFTETTTTNGLIDALGGWMGIGVGDFDCNSALDFFVTDTGYAGTVPSTWFLQQADGTYVEGDVESLGLTPFGWGVSMLDYDNDADSDILFHGSFDVFNFALADNPGALMQNEGNCSGTFVYDDTAVLQNHVNRMVEGMAVGDLNDDGFEDVVTVATATIVPNFYFPWVGFIGGPQGSPFDAGAMIDFAFNTFSDPVPYLGLVDENGVPIPHPNGDMTVELNSADNGNGWVEINALGNAGIFHASGGAAQMNRDGIGVVASFTPKDGLTSTQPVLGGSSYASQDSLALNFGLGTASKGTAEFLWPGGVRNKLYDIHNGEQLTMPYIPCSFDGNWNNFGQYNRCVRQALRRYHWAGEINFFERFRLQVNAIVAYLEHNYP